MENSFICPFCRGHLRVGEYIIFATKNSKKQMGLILLSPQIGNYTSIKHPDFEFKEGDKLNFFCPLCHRSLESDFEENLVRVIMVDEKSREHDIYFSRIAGEHSTYDLTGETVKATGEHSFRYTHFKMTEKFKKYLKR
jgi:hypothetical protein